MIDIRHFLCSLTLLIIVGAPICTVSASANAGIMDDDFTALLARLVDTDQSVRIHSAVELGLYGDDLLPALIQAYRGGDTITRRGAIAGMTLLPNLALAQDSLIVGLRDMDITTRSMAAHGLAILGTPVAPRLVELLEDEDSATRDAAAFGLRLMGTKGVPALAQGLETTDTFARSKAAWLLGRIGPPAQRAIPALINALDTDDDRVLHVVAEAIDLIGPDPAIALHHLTLINARPGCPVTRIGKGAAPTLVALLARPGTPLGQLAFRALADMDKIAEPPLRQCVESDNLGQQVACGLLLIEIDPDNALTLPEEVRGALADGGRQNQQ